MLAHLPVTLPTLQVSTGLGAGLPAQRAKNEWIEGVAIWVAIILVTGVGAANDYAKDKQVRRTVRLDPWGGEATHGWPLVCPS